eukprot:1249138-Amphidinium_carterae.1
MQALASGANSIGVPTSGLAAGSSKSSIVSALAWRQGQASHPFGMATGSSKPSIWLIGVARTAVLPVELPESVPVPPTASCGGAPD